MIPTIGTSETTPCRGETAAPQRKWPRVLQVEVANDDAAVRQLCADAYNSWQHAIGSYLRTRGIDQADQLAEAMLSAIEGALVLARVNRDADIVRRVGATTAGLVNR